jgi:hypothetical protein
MGELDRSRMVARHGVFGCSGKVEERITLFGTGRLIRCGSGCETTDINAIRTQQRSRA